MHFQAKLLPKLLLFAATILYVSDVSAHTINYAMEKAPSSDVTWFYLKLGVQHIIPFGLDHIFFITALCLINTKWKTILWQATAFTIAHSITLALSMKNIVSVPADIVEPIIALTIAFVAVENIFLSELKPWRLVLVFLFGLVHGLGFASSLSEIGLPRNQFYNSIISFNLGVEIGQIAIIAAIFSFLIIPFGRKKWYRSYIVFPISMLIACVALYWTVERMI